MDQKEFIYAMKVKGYVVFENVLRKSTVERIKKALNTLPKEVQYKGTIKNLFDKLPVDCITEVIENDVVLPRLDSLLGNSFIIHAFNSSPLYPGIKASTAYFHRDSGRFILGYDYAFNTLFSITDFTRVNGVTMLVPGSHIVEERPSDAYIAENALHIEVPAGSAVLFNSNIWHASGDNRSDETRWQVALTCRRSFMKQEIDLPRTLNSDIVEKLSERGRQLLGLYVSVPTSVEEFMLPESERLYRSGQG